MYMVKVCGTRCWIKKRVNFELWDNKTTVKGERSGYPRWRQVRLGCTSGNSSAQYDNMG